MYGSQKFIRAPPRPRLSSCQRLVLRVQIPLRDSVPLTLRKTLLYSQSEPILDVAVLEESASPTHIAVLDSEKVSIYRLQGAKWQPEQSMSISHSRPWPRDLRGKLVLDRDHLLQDLSSRRDVQQHSRVNFELPGKRRSVAARAGFLQRTECFSHGEFDLFSERAVHESLLRSRTRLFHRQP